MFPPMCVTHVLNFGPFLKIFGQTDGETVPQIDVALRQLHNQLLDQPTEPLLHEITAQDVYLVQQTSTSFFRRCKALNVNRSGIVRVTLIDHGHEFDVNLKQLQLIPDGPTSDLLRTARGQVSDGILCGVHDAAWDVARLDAIREQLVNTTVSYRVEDKIQNLSIISLALQHGDDVSELLLHQGLAQSISIADQKLLINQSMDSTMNKVLAVNQRPPKHALEPPRRMLHQPSPPLQVRGLVANRPLHSGIATSSKQMIMNHLSNNAKTHTTVPPNLPTYQPKPIEPATSTKNPFQKVASQQPPTNTPSSTAAYTPALRSNTLMVGSRHKIYVSYIEDGPSLFSVHLKSTEHDLDQLMAELGNYPLINLRDRPTIGMACVARYSEDQNLYRAVIMNIKPTTSLVAYVDYGNSEDVAFSDIYEIPPEFLDKPIFSIRFTLTGYQQLQPDTETMKDLFSSLVMDHELEMVVRPLDGPPFVQYCELLHNGESVFERLLSAKQHQNDHRLGSFGEPLELLDSEMVIIRGIESAQKFYVQQCRNLGAFEEMMHRLNQHGVHAAPLLQVRVGSIGMSYHSVAGSWCRVKVLSVGPPLVQYSDLGSVNEVQLSEIRVIPAELMGLPVQAIECCLEGFEDVNNVSQSTVDQLELLADTDTGEPRKFKVRISDRRTADGVLIVNLIDVAAQPILDVSQRVFMMGMPPNKFRQFESQRFQRLTATSSGKGIEVAQPPLIENKTNNNFLNSTCVDAANNVTVASSNWDTPNQSARSTDGLHELSANVRPSSTNPSPVIANGQQRAGELVQQQPAATETNVSAAKRVNKRLDEPIEQTEHDSSGHFSASTASGGSDDFTLATNELARPHIPLNDPRPSNVCVSWWISPLRFYVQFAEQLPDYTAMMDAIQEFYANRPSIGSPPAIGSYVVCRKPDGRFYRAQILNQRGNHYKFQCVDIGDKSDGPLECIWPLEQRFTKLDRVATQCALQGVALNYDAAHIDQLIVRILPKDVPNTAVFVGKDANVENSTWVELRVGVELLKDTLVRDGLVTAIPDGIDLYRLVGQVLSIRVSNSQLPDRFAAHISGDDANNVLVLMSRNFENGSALEGRQLVVHVDRLTEENCLVATPLPSSSWPITNLPVTANRFNISVSHIDLLNSYYVQNVANAPTLETLLNDMFEAYENSGEGDELLQYTPHSICAAKSTDGNWYRCRIEDSTPPTADTVLVRYIDYGNCEPIPTRLIRSLTTQFLTPNALALRVFTALSAAAPEHNVREEITKLTDGYMLDLCVIEFYEGSWIVDIGAHGHSLVNVLMEKKLVRRMDLQEVRMQIRESLVHPAFLPEPINHSSPKPNESAKVFENNSSTESTTGQQPQVQPTIVDAPPEPQVFENRIAGCMSHADRPDRFYIRLDADADALSSMHENIQIVAPALTDLLDFSVGTQCIVKYSADEQWYRAVIIDSDAAITSVQFLDYGNTDTITAAGLIKCMNEAFANIKAFAIPCALPLSPRQAVDWTDAACELMRNFCDQSVSFEYLSSGDNCNLVRLWLPPARDIMAELIRDGHASLVPFIESGQTAFVSHINSLDDFYIQMQQDTNSLEIISDYLVNIDQFPPLTEFPANKICTAKYVDDDGWYRAKILQHSPSVGTDVLFIDYGNTATAVELRELPQQIADMPHLSKQCALQMPPGVQLWSEEAEARFHAVSDMGATIFTVQLVQPSNRSSLVRLSHNDDDLSAELAVLCNRFNPCDMDVSAQMTASMLGGGGSATSSANAAEPIVVRGVLFRVNGAGDFYVLPDAQKAANAAIAEQLLLATSFPPVQVTHVGDLCVARPVDEERYLRARVLSINSDDHSAMCLFIDTGHSSIATDLRVPSATLAAAPKILEHYTLPDPKRDQMLAAGTTCFVHVLCTNTRPKVARLFATDADDLYCSRVGECVAEISMMATMKSGFVSHVESPSSFWFQAACDQMDAVLEELETADAFPCVKDAVLGGLYAAKWKEDDRFYRARLLRQEDEWGGFRVAFIDYGNSAVATDLRQLPESLQNLPEMVAHCRLQTDVTTAVDQYSAEPSLTMDQFRNLINADVALHIRLIDINTKPNVVRLFLDAELTKEIRVEDEDLMSSCASMSLHEGNVDSSTDGGAIDEANEEAENGFGAEETVDAVEAFLSWSVSSEDFYLQDKHRSEWGDQLVERLVDANGFAALTDRNVGDLCAARFVDDDAFYRARILSVDQSECNVHFIDYGNTSASSDLRHLPAELADAPAWATHCCLAASNAADAITAAGFAELCAEMSEQSFFYRIVDACQSPRIVRIFLDAECQQEVLVNRPYTVDPHKSDAGVVENVLDNVHSSAANGDSIVSH